jgi:thioredoxin reductase
MQLDGVRVLVAPSGEASARRLLAAADDTPRPAHEGYLVVGAEGATTVAGVFAGGGLTPGLRLVQVAAGSGAVAGIGCAPSLEKDPRTPPPLPPRVEDPVQVTSTGS